jgi:hypothetical protein
MGPFLAGSRLRVDDISEGGNDILYRNGKYIRNLSLARLGELPFLVLAAFVVWSWSRRLFGEEVALMSVLIFTMLPPILGHAGLATTDMAAAATCAAALYAFSRWLDRGDIRHSLVLGFTLALAVLSKFSSFLFLPACALALLAWRWRASKLVHLAGWQKRRFLAVGLIGLVACLLIWAGYRFSFGPLADTGKPLGYRSVDAIAGGGGPLHDLAHRAAVSLRLPAPEFIRGVWSAKARAKDDPGGYIFGKIRPGRCWYFFLVALAVKSPLAFLIMAGTGVVVLVNGYRPRTDGHALEPAVAAVAILLVSMPVIIHMGLRHILAVYPLLSIPAGFGAVSLWNQAGHRRWARGATLFLLGWLVFSSVHAHPDYLPYFNELAGSHPERILVDSDLDWGQDLLRLSDVLRARKVDRLSLAYFGTADPSQHRLPPFTDLAPFQPTTGWIAISMFNLKGGWPWLVGAYSWLETYKPVALVGHSIRLYYITEIPSDASSKTQHAVSAQP